MKWIKYRPRKKGLLPITNKVVIIFSLTEGIGLAVRHRLPFSSCASWVWLYKRINGSAVAQHVTHWMLLPKLPKDEIEQVDELTSKLDQPCLL